jgi:hypothetical protein
VRRSYIASPSRERAGDAGAITNRCIQSPDHNDAGTDRSRRRRWDRRTYLTSAMFGVGNGAFNPA